MKFTQGNNIVIQDKWFNDIIAKIEEAGRVITTKVVLAEDKSLVGKEIKFWNKKAQTSKMAKELGDKQYGAGKNVEFSILSIDENIVEQKTQQIKKQIKKQNLAEALKKYNYEAFSLEELEKIIDTLNVLATQKNEKNSIKVNI